jgi:hypothetical protein
MTLDFTAPAGAKVIAASVRWIPSYMDQVIMATPVPRPHHQGDGHDIQIEISLPRNKIAAVKEAWRGLGLQEMDTPAVSGGYWQALDFLTMPYCVGRIWGENFMLLPALVCRSVRKWLSVNKMQ